MSVETKSEGRELLTFDETERLYNETLERSGVGGDEYSVLDSDEQDFIRCLLCRAIKYDWERAESDPLNYGAPLVREAMKQVNELTKAIGEI